MQKLKLLAAALLAGMTTTAAAEVVLILDGEPYGMLTSVSYQPQDQVLVVETLDDWGCASSSSNELGGEREFKLTLDSMTYGVDPATPISLTRLEDLQQLVVTSLAGDLVCEPAGTPVFSDTFGATESG